MDGENTAPEVIEEAPAEGAEGETQSQRPDEVGVLKRMVSGLRSKLTRSETKNAQLAVSLKQTVDEVSKLHGQITGGQKQTAEANLRSLRRQALEAGDFDKFEEIDAKLAEVRQMPVRAKKIDVPDIESDPIVEDDEREVFAKWEGEKGSDGKPIRPWTKPGHPKFERAKAIGAAVFSDPEFATIEDKVAEIDRLMDVKKPARTQASVLSDKGGALREKTSTKLTEQEKQIAHRFFSKMDPKKAEETWAAAKAKTSKPSGVVGHA